MYVVGFPIFWGNSFWDFMVFLLQLQGIDDGSKMFNNGKARFCYD